MKVSAMTILKSPDRNKEIARVVILLVDHGYFRPACLFHAIVGTFKTCSCQWVQHLRRMSYVPSSRWRVCLDFLPTILPLVMLTGL
jgi:hypothetical protein